MTLSFIRGIQLLLVLGCILVASPRPEDSGSVMTVACTHEEDGASPSGLEDEQVGTETTRDMVTDGITSNVKKQLIGLVCTGIQVTKPMAVPVFTIFS